MRILMTKDAYGRIGGRLATIAPQAEVLTVAPGEVYERGGQAVDVAAVDPEVIWVTLDSWFSGLMPGLIGRALETPSTRWVQGLSAGIDAPIFRTILEKGLRLSRGAAQAVPIAEYVVAHALSLLVPIEAQAALQRERAWKATPYREVAQTHWLLVGYGNIGREIATRIKPFGVELTAVRRSAAADDLADRTVTQAELPAVLPDADVVVLACALNDETRGLANAAFFAALKPGAILINIGRGGLVDEEALRAGLDRDQPGHAVLDVFATEPLPADSWIWEHPKVRVSAHTSNSGQGTADRADALFLENLRRYLAKEPLLNEADPRDVGL
jgi:phosphoglycerate dehydrogenase-like enzyme